ncbi:SLC13 family permease [uncultured Desulfobacter sp.]|uniref:SLC13 family permease n=1 Tax=uncultured Desulfobacter sp. TaxID=240139 RepID=UPI0029F476BA|nr:SLC13 family permease [uncultured Desulfobacter sp.]
MYNEVRVATAFLSMWVSNTATAMMMVPIGLAVINQVTGLTSDDLRYVCVEVSPEFNFGRGLTLGIAYAASVGGVATIIDDEIRKLGPMSGAEKKIVAVGCLMAIFWLSRGFLAKAAFMHEIMPHFSYISDATIGIMGALLLFCIPVDFNKRTFLLDWQTAVRIPWDVILLFGGGLAIANGFTKTELATYIAGQLGALDGASLLVFICCRCFGGLIYPWCRTGQSNTANFLIKK